VTLDPQILRRRPQLATVEVLTSALDRYRLAQYDLEHARSQAPKEEDLF